MACCAADPNRLEFFYFTHRGVWRKVRADAATAILWAGSTEHYPEHQQLLTVWDLDRQAERTFAMCRTRWGGELCDAIEGGV